MGLRNCLDPVPSFADYLLILLTTRPSRREGSLNPTESPLYQKPILQKFGTFRELTQFGESGASDGFAIRGIGTSPGCSSGGFDYRCPTAS